MDWKKIRSGVQSVHKGDSKRVDLETSDKDQKLKVTIYRVGQVVRMDIKPA